MCGRVSPIALPRSTRSSNDRREAELFQRCQTCKFAHYCNSDCQRADWRRHRRICASVGRAYRAEDRHQIHDGQQVHTAFGFGTLYDLCLWHHILKRLHREEPRATTSGVAIIDRQRGRTIVTHT